MTNPQTPLRILVVDDDPISRTILEEHLAASAVTYSGQRLEMTVSVGLADQTPSTGAAEFLLDAADAALYAAKQAGRNATRRSA